MVVLTMTSTTTHIPARAPSSSTLSQSGAADTMSVSEIKEFATSNVQKIKNASLANLFKVAKDFSESAALAENQGDLKCALRDYIMASSLIQNIYEHHDYKAELADPKKRGVFWKEFKDFSAHFMSTSVPRTRKLEARLRELEQAQQQSENRDAYGTNAVDGPNNKHGGSIVDRIQALQVQGLSVGVSKRFSRDFSVAGPPPRPRPLSMIGKLPVSTAPIPATPTSTSTTRAAASPPIIPSTLSSPHTFVSTSSLGPPSPTSSVASSPSSNFDIGAMIASVTGSHPPSSLNSSRIPSHSLRSESEFISAFPSIDELDKKLQQFPSVPTGEPGQTSLPAVPTTKPGRPLPTPPSITKHTRAAADGGSGPRGQDLFLPLGAKSSSSESPHAFTSVTHRGPPPPRPASTPIPPIRNGVSQSPSPEEGSPVADVRRELPVPPTARAPGKYTNGSAPKFELKPTNTIYPKILKEYRNHPYPKILYLDIRARAEFDMERMRAAEIVCLEPNVLSREKLSSTTIESALVISPSTEQVLFANRSKFDLVVIYDNNSTVIEGPIRNLIHAIYEMEFRNPLKRPPVLLVGGLEAWRQEVGDDGLLKEANHLKTSPPVTSPEPPSTSPADQRLPSLMQPMQPSTQAAAPPPSPMPPSSSPVPPVPASLLPGVSPVPAVPESSSQATSTTTPLPGTMPSATSANTISSTTKPVSPMPGVLFSTANPMPANPASPPQDGHERWYPPRPRSGTDSTSERPPLYSTQSSAPRPYPSGQTAPMAAYTSYDDYDAEARRLNRRQAIYRPPSSGHIPTFNRPPSGIYNSHYSSQPSLGLSYTQPSGSIQYPSVMPVPYPASSLTGSPSASSSSGPSSFRQSPNDSYVSPPPVASINPSPLSRRRNDYADQAYSGVTRLSIDYPDLSAQHVLRPPPAAASPVLERQDQRPRAVQPTHSYSSPRSSAPVAPTIQSDYPVIYWADLQIGISGLKNLGNTCYMNATIQCLSATVPFSRFFTDGRWKNAVNMVNPLGSKGNMAKAFATLLHDIWHGDLPYISPNGFRKSVCTFAPQFSGADQHDSQEFLSFLLDGLHEDLNRVLHKPHINTTPDREAQLEFMPQQIASEQEWKIYRMRNDSIVVDYFQGQFRNRLQCLTCHKTSTTYNPFMYLSLPLPSGRTAKTSLEQCLDAFVRDEVLEKSEAWNCPNCKTLRKATKRLSLSRLPPVLMIHLKRFSFKGPFTDKLDTLVDFPIKGLDLTNYLPPPLPPGADNSNPRSHADDPRTQLPPYKYDLYGVTNHFGSLSSGHYTAYISSRGGWLYCDDSRVTNADSKDIVGRPAYVLYYKRVQY